MHTAQQSLSISYDLYLYCVDDIEAEIAECGREEIKQISIK